MSSAVLILNSRSGGGRRQAGVRAAATRLGIDIREVGPGASAAALAAAADAQVLVVGGGDGTVGAVAEVAVARNLPLVLLPCGTRNHFAADAGLNLDDPELGLSAVADGVERRVDVGVVNSRMFLNNVSLGFYSSMVGDPQYRSRRVAVTGRYLRRALLGGGPALSVSLRVEPRVVLPERVLTILVSNNAYSPGMAPGAALRPRLDEGVLWMHVLGISERGPVGVRLVRAAVDVLVGRSQVAAWPAATHTLQVDRSPVTVGMDGEAVELGAPLELACLPGALRLLYPRSLEAQRHTVTLTT